MQIYFLRHADAFPKGPKYREDNLRPLTSEGKKQAKQIARFLQGIHFDVILTSPFVRAEQTAQILSDRLGSTIKVCQDLVPGFNLNKLPKVIEPYRKYERIVLVGHEPDFTETVKKMIGGKVEIDLRKGGLAMVEVEAEKGLSYGKLILLIQPEFLT
jgi:phosphohistidine phosphatase